MESIQMSVVNIRYRIYPTQEQEVLMNKTFGCCRLVYNFHLNERNKFWNQHKKEETSESITKKPFTTEKQMKKQFPFLKEVSSAALQQSRRDCDTAFNNWFRSIKGLTGVGQKHPKFKSKKSHRYSYRESMVSETCLDYPHRLIKIPKVGQVKFKSRKEGNKNWSNIKEIKHLTVIKETDGRYYVALCIDCLENRHIPDRENQSIGLDWSPSMLYVDSNGNNGKMFGYQAFKQKSAKKLHRLQKKMMKKQKDSKNREKARQKIACLESHVARQRKDFLEKESLRLVKEYDIIGIEDLNLKGIARFLRNAKNVNETSWRFFTNRLIQKAVRWNSVVIKADRYFASSQICSKCRYRNTKLKLKDRKWICPECGKQHSRDMNAAINLRNNALHTVGSTGIEACGDNDLCFEKSEQVVSMKQEVKDVSLNENLVNGQNRSHL